MSTKEQDPLDAVRRALIAADCKAVSERTQMPEGVVMALAQSLGWSADAAEKAIEDAMKDVADTIRKETEQAFFHGGGPGGGKSDFQYRVHASYGAEVVRDRALGVIATCVS